MDIWIVVIFLVIMVGGGVFIIYGAITVTCGVIDSIISKKWKKEFNKMVEERLNAGTLKTQDQMENLHETFISQKNSNSFYEITIDMKDMLNNFLLYAKGLNEESRDLITSFIEHKKEIIPFKGVPYEERDYMIKINKHLIGNEAQNYYAVQNLRLLGDRMAKRNRKYKKTKKFGIWGIVVGIISIAATVIAYIYR